MFCTIVDYIQPSGRIFMTIRHFRDSAADQLMGPSMKRTVALHVDTGAEAEQYADEAKNQKLKPLEQELVRLEHMSDSLLQDLETMRRKEEEMRDVNGMYHTLYL
jgi:predicted nuclease with TOPRIM domain